MLVLVLLVLMPMTVRLALTLMLLLDAFDVVAYAATDDTHAEEEMPNDARHLVGASDCVDATTVVADAEVS